MYVVVQKGHALHNKQEGHYQTRLISACFACVIRSRCVSISQEVVRNPPAERAYGSRLANSRWIPL